MPDGVRDEVREIVARNIAGPGSADYLREVLANLDEWYGEAEKDGNATAMEMFMASMLLVEDRLRRTGRPPRGGGRR